MICCSRFALSPSPTRVILKWLRDWIETSFFSTACCLLDGSPPNIATHFADECLTTNLVISLCFWRHGAVAAKKPLVSSKSGHKISAGAGAVTEIAIIYPRLFACAPSMIALDKDDADEKLLINIPLSNNIPIIIQFIHRCTWLKLIYANIQYRWYQIYYCFSLPQFLDTNRNGLSQYLN